MSIDNSVPLNRQIIAGANVTINGGASATLEDNITIASSGGGGGGGQWELISNTTISVSTPFVDYDVSNYQEINLAVYNVTADAGGIRAVLISVDNGANYYNTSGDYQYYSNAGVVANNLAIGLHATNSSGARGGLLNLYNLRDNNSFKTYETPTNSEAGGGGGGLFTASLLPITNIRVYSIGGNMLAGQIIVSGLSI